MEKIPEQHLEVLIAYEIISEINKQKFDRGQMEKEILFIPNIPFLHR